MLKLFLIIFISLLQNIKAQTINPGLILSCGDINANLNYQAEWSLGEILAVNSEKANNSVIQEVHQDAQNIKSSFKINYTGINMTIFPNPSSNFIIIKYSGKNIFKKDIIELHQGNKKLDIKSKVTILLYKSK